MAVLVYSVVRRHMKRTSPGAFTSFEPGPTVGGEPPLRPAEPVIGWYQNPHPWQDSFVIFTSEALYVVEAGRSDRIAIADIIGYEDPETKSEATGVRVLTNDGGRFIRIAGSFGPSGNRKDAYSFIMVLRALIPGEPVVKQTPSRE
jgi:hypothetical protein